MRRGGRRRGGHDPLLRACWSRAVADMQICGHRQLLFRTFVGNVLNRPENVRKWSLNVLNSAWNDRKRLRNPMPIGLRSLALAFAIWRVAALSLLWFRH